MRHESPQMARVRDARAMLLLTHPFFGVLSLKVQLMESPHVSTMGVSTTTLVFNPAFVEKCTQAELKGVVAHEVMHLGLLHHARMGDREKQRWNMACDYAINRLLVEDNFVLPEGALLDSKYDNMTAEQIYNLLKDDPRCQPNSGQPDGSEATGTFDGAGADGSADAGEAARVWAENAQEAARAAKAAGKLPANIEREVMEAAAPKANWREVLRRFMSDRTKVRTTWSLRNKRFPHIHLPGKTREGMGPVALLVDTSGSIGPDTLAAFAAECNAIVQDCEPAAVHVVYCDADVNRVESFEHGEELTLRPCGGGGTDFRPAFRAVDESGWNPCCVIYLTDLMGAFPEVEPDYPVLWAAYGAGGAVGPWGETVVIDG